MAARARNWALYLAGAGASALFLYLLAPHLGPLILGLLLAVLIDRPVTSLERRGIGRGLGAFLILAGGALLTAAVVGWLGAALYGEVRELAVRLPARPQAVATPAGGAAGGSGPWAEPLPPLVRDLVQQAVDAAHAAAGQWVAGVVQAVARLPSLVWPLTVTTLIAYFASRDRHLLTSITLTHAPPRLRRRAARLRSLLLLRVAAFLHAQVLLIGLSTVLSTTALLLLGSPYALSLGLLAGILDLVPFLGPAAVFGALTVLWAVQGAPSQALAAAAAGLAVFGARQAVEPRLLAGRTQLHPLTVVLAVYLGSRLLGATGFLLGPVVALAVRTLVVEGEGAFPRG